MTGLISFLWLGVVGFPDSFLKSFCTMSLFTKSTQFILCLPVFLTPYPLEYVTMCGVHSLLSLSGMPPNDYSCLPRNLYRVIHSCLFQRAVMLWSHWHCQLQIIPHFPSCYITAQHSRLIKVAGAKFTTISLHVISTLITGCCMASRLYVPGQKWKQGNQLGGYCSNSGRSINDLN